MKILVGGNRALAVDDELAMKFKSGDSIAVVEKTEEVLHIPAAERRVAEDAVDKTVKAFGEMGAISDEAISLFFESFAEALADEAIWQKINIVNQEDIALARSRGRSTTRLEATPAMRQGMIDGLRGWAKASSQRGRTIETIDHGSWKAELIGSELGVVAFIFEGRPNVVADATGVLRGGNTVVFRIGRDALNTAKAILDLATRPALAKAGLPEGAVTVVDSASHAAGWALFQDSRLSLAVARGSGRAVDTLGALAQSAGVPVSLHGTGGAWLVVSQTADPKNLEAVVADSLDRKVCNTLNTCCIPRSQAQQFIPAFLAGLEEAGRRRSAAYKLHVAKGSEDCVPSSLFEKKVQIGRAEGLIDEMQAELIDPTNLGQEWEWEDSPEVTLQIVDDTDQAVALFNAQSPQFVCTLLGEDEGERALFWQKVNAPFVGDGFTRWVDGQYALNRPELGLSNWENGRLFGRGGVLSGDSVFTVRTKVTGTKQGKPRQ
ncbi:MAG: aldehyde dehydrogenase family protein [Polyangiaceae bacterium]|nr:aldehyde dehydrogenase family protein [Polyangiaceae bacterium]